VGRVASHTPTIYIVKRDNLPTIDFVLRDNERAATGYYLDPRDPDTWKPVNLANLSIVGWFRAMCGNKQVLFGMPVLRHAPFSAGHCTLLGTPSPLMDIPVGWYEMEIEVTHCPTSYKQTVWKRFKFCLRDDFDSSEMDGRLPPIYRDSDGNIVEVPVKSPPKCETTDRPQGVLIPYDATCYEYSGTATDPDGHIIAGVWFRVNGGAQQTATILTGAGTPSVTFEFTACDLEVGYNLIEVITQDCAGACSVVLECGVIRKANLAPEPTIDCGLPPPPPDLSECFTGFYPKEEDDK